MNENSKKCKDLPETVSQIEKLLMNRGRGVQVLLNKGVQVHLDILSARLNDSQFCVTR